MAKTKVHGEYLDASVISGQTQVTAVGADSVLIFDATDNALKKALLSDVIETVADGDISTAKLADDAVTSAKIDTNIDIAGTFDVTGATTLDSTLTVAGDANFDSGTLFVDVSTDKVGIGTTAPDDYWSTASNLVVKQSSGNGGISIVTGTSEVGQLYFADGTSGDAQYRGWLNYSHADDKMALATAASIRMTILSDGKVGIGTTSPTAPLHIATTTDDAYSLRLEGATNNSANYHGIGLAGESSNTKTAILYKDLASSYARGNLLFCINDAADQTSATDSDVRMAVTASGITFNGDTAAANALDDYEEGSWTPVATTSASNSTITTTVNYAKYIKVGGLVHASCYLSLNISAVGTGAAMITGLPFTATSTQGYNLGIVAHATAVASAATHGISAYVTNGHSNVRMVGVTDAANPSWVAGNPKYIMIDVTYHHV